MGRSRSRSRSRSRGRTQARKTVKQRCVEILAAAKPPVLRLVFQAIIQRLVDARKEKERKIAERKERFQELLEEYYYRGDHVTVTWEKARKRLKKRSSFRDVGDEDLAKSYFEAYINMLKEKLGENLGEEEADAEEGELDGDGGDSDDSDDGRKRKKKKKKKKKKKRSRKSSSSSRSNSDERESKRARKFED